MTQVELAKKLGVGTTSVYNWCSGTKIPRMDKVDKMCDIFGCKRSDLITEPDRKRPAISDEIIEFYQQYLNLPPDLKSSVDSIIKSQQHKP